MLTFGVIAGVVLSSISTILFYIHSKDMDFGDNSLLVGYLVMIISFSIIFFAVRSYRDNVKEGRVTFGKGFLVGLYITLIASVFYVVVWEIYYQTSFHEFAQQYFAQSAEKAKASGLQGEELQKEIDNMKEMADLYTNNVLFRWGMTFIEPLPVGLLISLISAVLLRRKRGDGLSSTVEVRQE